MKFDSSYLWNAKYAKWIIFSLGIFFSLLILIEIVSVFTFRQWINTKTGNEKITPPPVIKPVSIVENFDTELFGHYIPPDISASDIKASKLDVVVVGILFAEDKEDSQVIIRTSDGNEQPYKIGDTLSGSAVIKRIIANGVVVEHNGELESLTLPQDALTFEPPPKPLVEE